MDRDLETLMALSHHRWAAPILAELQRAQGSKFVTLAGRLAVSRESLRRTLDALVEKGWVRRNPGHGHPMRPEYLLTEAGEALGVQCVGVVDTVAALRLEQVAFRKWSLPVLVALHRGATRFGEIRSLLPTVTPRALTLALKELQVAGLVRRDIDDGYPPTSVYGLTARGRHLARKAHGGHDAERSALAPAVPPANAHPGYQPGGG